MVATGRMGDLEIQRKFVSKTRLLYQRDKEPPVIVKQYRRQT